jgi:hypothetical protein
MYGKWGVPDSVRSKTRRCQNGLGPFKGRVGGVAKAPDLLTESRVMAFEPLE